MTDVTRRRDAQRPDAGPGPHRRTRGHRESDRQPAGEQITTLTAELAQIERELADLATTRTTLRGLTAAEFTADDPTIASARCQQILAILDTTAAGMRAKDICIALGVEPSPKHVEGARAKLKRMVNRQILTEDMPGVHIRPETRSMKLLRTVL